MVAKYDRQYSEAPFEKDDPRSPGLHDRDRILYSSAFRRLSGVTQVISPWDRQPTHNRLTHTLEVAQIAKSISDRLLARCTENQQLEELESVGGLDSDVVEAAALAHDLGHPPFGHVAEDVLNQLVLDFGLVSGFEGNAQSFRILTKLSVKNVDIRGLNLTWGTLSGVTKYPWSKGENDNKKTKWGAYQTESDILATSRTYLPASEHTFDPRVENHEWRTIEAQIMDWSDDVAYAIHDLEDFYRMGVLPLERIAKSDTERLRLLEFHYGKRKIEDVKRQETISEAAENLFTMSVFQEPYTGSLTNRANLRQFTSTMVRRCLANVSVSFTDSQCLLEINQEDRDQIELLKDIIWCYMIEGRALSTQRFGYRKMIQTIFDTLCVVGTDKFVDHDWKQKTDDLDNALRTIPMFFREQIEEKGPHLEDAVIVRAVADVISGLTEAQALGLYRRITGHDLGSALDPIVI